MQSHEEQLDILDFQYEQFKKKSHKTPLTDEVLSLISFAEGYKYQAELLLIKAHKLEKIMENQDIK